MRLLCGGGLGYVICWYAVGSLLFYTLHAISQTYIFSSVIYIYIYSTVCHIAITQPSPHKFPLHTKYFIKKKLFRIYWVYHNKEGFAIIYSQHTNNTLNILQWSKYWKVKTFEFWTSGSSLDLLLMHTD